MAEVTKEKVLAALRQVRDPDLNRDIVSLNFVKEVKICDGLVGLTIELTTPACPVKDQLKNEAARLVREIPGVERVEITMTAQTVGRKPEMSELLKGVRNVVAIGSGKGGVGKSTATVNLALALQRAGAKVGILDADIYGPSIPGMLGIHERPTADAEGRALPPERHGIRCMSVGMLVGEDAPTIWRGPIASRLLQQFLAAVHWGELDYLLLDLPPGTGDVQLTLCQSAPLSGAVIVTTPQAVALRIARKGLKMFQQVNVPILGILENMSGDIFGRGGAQQAALELGVPFLGSVPLDPAMVAAGDAGLPLVASHPDSPAALAFEAIARQMAAQLSIFHMKEREVTDRPVEVKLVEHAPPTIRWSDGQVLKYNIKELRLASGSAENRDEMSGQLLTDPQTIPEDITVTAAHPVGRYGLNLVFSDGHSTGIYTFEKLRGLGKPVGAG